MGRVFDYSCAASKQAQSDLKRLIEFDIDFSKNFKNAVNALLRQKELRKKVFLWRRKELIEPLISFLMFRRH